MNNISNQFSVSLITLRVLVYTLITVLLGTQTAYAIESITFYHHDVLGAPVAATDEAGNLKWREDYQPYGERIRKPTNATENSLWYTGKPEEPELGLQYFGARWYDPQLGRFTGIDPVGFSEGSIHSFNRYAYANNNPCAYLDPNGEEPMDAVRAFGNTMINTAIYSSVWGTVLDGSSAIGLGQGVPQIDYVDQADGKYYEAGLAVLGVIIARGRSSKSLANDIASVTKGGGKADKAPDFVVSPSGTAFPVPKGSAGPTPVVNPASKKTGDAFTGGSGGANGQVDTMRIMDPTPPHGNSSGYPNGYIKYENKSGQGVDPYTGRTLSNKDSHFPID